jgi:hypothetical protein
MKLARIFFTFAVLAIAVHTAGGDVGVRHDTKGLT